MYKKITPNTQAKNMTAELSGIILVIEWKY
jgi:hypothetical protein